MITTVTLNASIDKAYEMDGGIENGTVMRVRRVRNSAGGKGLNVARVVKLCGEEVLSCSLTGGFNGAYLESLLDKDGIRHDFEHISGETRSCINILDKTYGSTEYLEPGCEVSAEEEARFLQRFPEMIKDSTAVTMSGSAPKGMSQDIYRRMICLAKEAGKLTVLDTSGKLLEYGLEGCPDIVKPNKEELETLLQIKIKSLEDVLQAAKKIQAFGIPYVTVSLGGDGALMLTKDGAFHAKPPEIRTVNTVGCGDSMTGALAVAFHRQYAPKEALRYAVAAASANAMSPDTGNFDRAVAEKLSAEIKVQEI